MAKSSSSRIYLVFVIAIVAMLALPIANGCSSSSGSTDKNAAQTNNTAQSTKDNQRNQDPDANLTPKTPPQNGQILDGSEGGNSGVQVNAAPGSSAYVKVKDMSGHVVVGFFVKSGSTAQVYVPEGTYSVQFAMGETWYGKSKRFGSRTSFGQDQSISLGYGDIITYTLQQTTSGNFSMSSLDESQF